MRSALLRSSWHLVQARPTHQTICLATVKLVQSAWEGDNDHDFTRDYCRHSCVNEDLEVYERKYGMLSETFYELYLSGEEPEDEAWILDWADWAGAYKILLRRQEQYRRTMKPCGSKLPPWPT